MNIRCPFCGERDVHEFHFHTLAADSAAPPVERVYQRENLRDFSREYWQHAAGCGAWLLVERNPTEDEVLSVTLLGERL